MRKTKKILGILLSCMMLLSMLSVGVFADQGTQADPIDAATKWFGYGADTYLLNPTIAAGTTDGIWYTLTAEQSGVLFLEHSYKNVDYTVYVTVNGKVYEGGCVDGKPYNRPIHTYPLAVGDVATVQIVTKDAAAGTVYANMNIISGDTSIKVKTTNYPIYVGAGQTVYYQDDSLNAEYATKYVTLAGDSVSDITLYTVVTNATTGAVTHQSAFADTDGDNVIEGQLGGSEGSAGVPAVKPAWAIENNSGEDRCFVLSVVAAAHECVYDDEADADCNKCGAIREMDTGCKHEYDDDCDVDCNLCGEERTAPHYLKHKPAVIPADCTEEGNSEYWLCTECKACFGDAQASYQVNPAWMYYTGDHVRPDNVAPCAEAKCKVCKEIDYGVPCTRPENAPVCQDVKCIYCNATVYGWGCNYNTGDEEVQAPLCQPGDCIYCGTHYEKLYDCENGSWAPCTYDGECSYGCGKQYPATGVHEFDEGVTACDGGLCILCWTTIEPGHTYSHIFATACDVCGAVREINATMTNGGESISEDVNGLAAAFDILVPGMKLSAAHVADYTNATFGGMKLVTMGAVVSNNYDTTNTLPTLEDVNDVNVVNVSAEYLLNLDEKTGVATYAIRIIDIPAQGKDVSIAYAPYVVVEDAEGVQYTVYMTDCAVISTYNSVANG